MIKVAVVGVGLMGYHHARNYFSLPGAKLVAICDIDRKRGEGVAKTFGTNYYSGHKELLANETINCASITVPTLLHKKIALDFINRGISVLIEKPLASSSKDAMEIIEQARKNKVELLVGHIERYNPAVIEIEKLVKKEFLGKILSIVIKRVGLYPPRLQGVNVVTDLAIHDLDIVSMLLKKTPDSIFARGASVLKNKMEDHAEIFLNYKDINCFIQANWLTPVKIRRLEITGTSGYVELDYITQKITLYKLRRPFSPLKITSLKKFSSFLNTLGRPRKIEIPVLFDEPLRLELINFINAVRNKEPLRISPEDALKSVLLVEAVNKSIKTKQEVKLL